MRASAMLGLCASALASTLAMACSGGDAFTAAPADGSSDAGSSAPPAPASAGGLTVDRARIDFGAAPCGDAAAAETLTLRNAGARDFAYSAFIDDDAAFTIGGATKGGLGPGASSAIVVTPKPIAASAIAGQPIAATLTITSDDPAHPVQTIALQVVPTGGTLDVSPSTVDFGQVPLGAPPASAPVTVRNTGNAALTLAIGKPADKTSPFAISGASTVTLAPGATIGGASATFAPSGVGLASAEATVTVSGPSCGASAAKISLRGQGTAGSAQVSPGALDFDVRCGAISAAAAQSIVVTNRGSAPLVVSNVAVSGPFKLATESTDHRLAPSGVTAIAVVAEPVAAGDLGGARKDGSLSFDTSDPDQPHVSLPLHATIVGANLAFAIASGAPASRLDFGAVASGGMTTQSLRVVNSGNASATVSPSLLTAPFGWSSSAARGIGPGASVAFGVTFAPSAAGAFSAVANVDTADGVCVAPDALPVAGMGSAPSSTPPAAVRDGDAGASGGQGGRGEDAGSGMGAGDGGAVVVVPGVPAAGDAGDGG